MRRVVVWWAKPLHFLQTPLLPTAKFAKSPAKKLAAIERDRKQRCSALPHALRACEHVSLLCNVMQALCIVHATIRSADVQCRPA